MSGRQDKLADPSAHEPAREPALAERSSGDGRVTLLAPRDLVDALAARGLLRDAPLAALDGVATTDFRGRGRPVRLEVGGTAIVAKSMRHGGLAGRLLADRFLGDARARELADLHATLAKHGVATPRLAFVRMRRGAAGLMRLDVATREIAGACDGVEFLRSRPPAAARREAVRAAAAVVRSLHDAGVEHADLNLRNLLVRAGPPLQAWVIDLEKSRRWPALPTAAAARNLERLARSAEKLGLLGTSGGSGAAGPLLARTDLLRFARAYGGAGWREPFEAARRRYRALAPWHRLGWALWGRRPAADRG